MADEATRIWQTIVELHQAVKEFSLEADEMGLGYKTFLQPAQEQKHTLEHIIRAKADELSGGKKAYTIKSLEKALGHSYRAFFDSADFISITLRDKILDTLAPYPLDIIAIACPDYFKTIKPRLRQLDKRIAKHRQAKDAAKPTGIASVVKEYQQTLTELGAIYDQIMSCVPDLEAEKLRRRKTFIWGLAIKIIIGIAVGVIVIGLGVYLFGSKP